VIKLKWIIIVLTFLLVGAAIAWGLSEYVLKVPTSGYVETNYALTSNMTAIDWGTMTVGNPKTAFMNITNTGSRNFTSLDIYVENWTTNLISFDLFCTASSSPLEIGESITAKFTLIINTATEGSFSFDIGIKEATT
jgi:hypothetical protein